MNSEEEFKKVSAVEQVYAKKHYDDYIKSARPLPNSGLFFFIAVGLILDLMFEGYFGIVGFLLSLSCIGVYFKGQGHEEGFFDGFDHGYKTAVNKALETDK